jgi:hypothetical protein
MVLESFCPPMSSQPCTWTWLTGSRLGDLVVVTAVADRREVVDQRVVPDVEDVVLVPGHRHAPGDRGSGDRDVAQAALDERVGLVALGLGGDEVGVRGVVLEQTVLEGAEPEEPVLLLHLDQRPAVDRAVPVDARLGREVVLTAHAVEALVHVLVDVAVLVDGGEELLDALVVARLGRADEVVVADVEDVPGLLESRGRGVRPVTGRHVVLGRRVGHLLAVLVGAGEELGLVADQPVPTGHGVGVDGAVGVAHVRGVVHVVDRGGDVEATHRSTLPTQGTLLARSSSASR